MWIGGQWTFLDRCRVVSSRKGSKTMPDASTTENRAAK
jgi:hypothetical protein